MIKFEWGFCWNKEWKHINQGSLFFSESSCEVHSNLSSAHCIFLEWLFCWQNVILLTGKVPIFDGGFLAIGLVFYDPSKTPIAQSWIQFLLISHQFLRQIILFRFIFHSYWHSSESALAFSSLIDLYLFSPFPCLLQFCANLPDYFSPVSDELILWIPNLWVLQVIYDSFAI